MTPPKEYFEQVPEGTAGAQRVGPYWYAFISTDSLFEMMNFGIFEESDDDEDVLEAAKQEARRVTDEVLSLEGELEEAEETIEKLEAELAELKARQAETK